jgi:hypothetical protein
MEKKTEQMNEELTAADKRLHDTIQQMKVANDIRAMIENGAVADDIYTHVLSLIKVGVQTKDNALKEIQKLHLELANRHIKLTDQFQFVYIGERGKD